MSKQKINYTDLKNNLQVPLLQELYNYTGIFPYFNDLKTKRNDNKIVTNFTKLLISKGFLFNEKIFYLHKKDLELIEHLIGNLFDENKYNITTFYGDFADVERMSETERKIYQYLHYLSTYGIDLLTGEFGKKRDIEFYVNNDRYNKENIEFVKDELVSNNILKEIFIEHIDYVVKIFYDKTIYSNVSLNVTLMLKELLLTLSKYYDIDESKIKNKEIAIVLFDNGILKQLKTVDDILRYAIYKASNCTSLLIIKNEETKNYLKHGNLNVNDIEKIIEQLNNFSEKEIILSYKQHFKLWRILFGIFRTHKNVLNKYSKIRYIIYNINKLRKNYKTEFSQIVNGDIENVNSDKLIRYFSLINKKCDYNLFEKLFFNVNIKNLLMFIYYLYKKYVIKYLDTFNLFNKNDEKINQFIHFTIRNGKSYKLDKYIEYSNINLEKVKELNYKYVNYLNNLSSKYDLRTISKLAEDVLSKRILNKLKELKIRKQDIILENENLKIALPLSNKKSLSPNCTLFSYYDLSDLLNDIKSDYINIVIGVYWKNVIYNCEESRIDIDLSAALCKFWKDNNRNFKIINKTSWDSTFVNKNEKILFVHTGDMTSAPLPDGATEMILMRCKKKDLKNYLMFFNVVQFSGINKDKDIELFISILSEEQYKKLYNVVVHKNVYRTEYDYNRNIGYNERIKIKNKYCMMTYNNCIFKTNLSLKNNGENGSIIFYDNKLFILDRCSSDVVINNNFIIKSVVDMFISVLTKKLNNIIELLPEEYNDIDDNFEYKKYNYQEIINLILKEC